jgi:glycerophosphoryl diester phosphodiesterase
MNFIRIASICILLGLATSSIAQHKEKIRILPAHAHNDYQHTQPLLDALDCTFKSIEADVFSVGDSLFVAHDFDKITPGRTLRKLYLDPLQAQVAQNHGSVYGEGTELILFVDIKDDGERTYKLLHQILESYSEMLTSYSAGKKNPGAIAMVVSGNRPLAYMQSQKIRYAGYDGRIPDLDSGLDATIMPLVSDNWNNFFSWKGKGAMPADEKERLQLFAQTAHDHGYMLRFWANPDRPGAARTAVWTALQHAQVDLIGTDDLKGLQSMFLGDK